MRKTAMGILPVLALALALTPATGIRAASTEQAEAWLEKMATAAAESYEVSYVAEMNMKQGGQAMQMDMSGEMLQGGNNRMRGEFEMNIKMDMMPDGLKMSAIFVSDGTTGWVEMNNPMLGGKQVMKVPYDRIEEMTKANPALASLANTDPLKQVRQMVELFDLEVAEDSGDKIVLSAELSAEGMAQLGQALTDGDTELGKLTLVIDKKSSFPTEVTMGGTPPIMRMTFSDYRPLDEVSADRFTYTPPDDVPVMDLGAMMDGGGR